MMTVLRSALKRSRRFLKAAAEIASPSTRFVGTRHYCPHCEEETEWQVNVLHRFYFCTQCRRDPKLSPAHYEAACREAEARSAETERGIESPQKPAGHREAGREAVPA